MTELEFITRSHEIVKIASKLKASMMKRHLKRAKAKCPKCEGFLHDSIGGHRDHLHMYCDDCSIIFME